MNACDRWAHATLDSVQPMGDNKPSANRRVVISTTKIFFRKKSKSIQVNFRGVIAPLLLEIELRCNRNFCYEFSPLHDGAKIFDLSFTISEIDLFKCNKLRVSSVFFEFWGSIVPTQSQWRFHAVGRCILHVIYSHLKQKLGVWHFQNGRDIAAKLTQNAKKNFLGGWCPHLVRVTVPSGGALPTTRRWLSFKLKS